MQNSNLSLLLASKVRKTNAVPAKKYLIQCKPEVAEELRSYFAIPANTSDAGCAEYFIAFAQVAKDLGYTFNETTRTIDAPIVE